MKTFKNSKRYLAFALTFLMPIYANFELLAEQNKEKIEVIENINNKEEAKKEIDKLITLTEEAEENNNLNQTIFYLEKILKIEKKFFGEKSNDVSNTLNWIGRIYLNKDEYDKSEKLFNDSLKIKKNLFEPNSIEFLKIFNNLGILYYQKKLYSKAEEEFFKALKVIKNEKDYKNRDYAYTFFWLGETYYEMGFFEKANNYYQDALKIEESILGEKHIDLALTNFSIAVNFNESGFFDKAETFFLRALEIEKKELGMDHEDTATTLNAIGENYLELGKYEEAKNYLTKSLTIRERILDPFHPDISTSLNDLALYYWYSSHKYHKAESLLLKALEIDQKVYGKDSIQVATIYSNLGLIYSALNQTEKALDYNKRSLKIRENYYGKKHFRTLVSKNNVAINLMDLEKYEEAKIILKEVLEIEKKIFGNSPSYALILHNLGGLYSQTKEYKEAKNLLEKSIKINTNKLGGNHPIIGNSLNTLGGIYEEQGEYEKAKKYFEKSLKIYEKIYGKDSIELTQFQSLAYLNYILGNYQTSKEQFKRRIINELFFIQEELPFLPLKDREKFVQKINIYNAGDIYSIFKNEAKELALFSRLNAQGLINEIDSRQNKYISKLGKNNKLITDLKNINSRLSMMNINDDKKQILLKEKDIIEKKLYRKLPELKPRIINISSVADSIPKDGILIEFQKYTPTRFLEYFGIGINYFIDKSKGFLIENIYDNSPALIEGLREKDIIISVNQIPTKGLNIQKAEEFLINKTNLELVISRGDKKLKKNLSKSKIIDWVPEEERYLAITLNSKGKINIIDLGLSQIIDSKVNKAISSSEQGLIDAQSIWDELSNIILKPLQNEIIKSNTLFISPDSELNRVAFSALKDPKTLSFLSDKYKIRLITTGRELIKLKSKSKLKSNKSLVIANPSFSLKRDIKNQKQISYLSNKQKRSIDLKSFEWGPLPGTKKEGEYIANLTKGDLLMEDKATVLAIQESQTPYILHIASHAFYLPNKKNEYTSDFDDPLLRSGIVLAGANKNKKNPIDDGYLTALEASLLDLSKTELIVISGCESGIGDIKTGEGVYGLKRAFSIAGSRSSLLSLWKVGDNATAEFMESFYLKLKNGEGRAEALANTQKEFRNHPIEAWRHPNVWAAFQLSGDWRPIDF